MNFEQKYNKLVDAIKVLQETNPSDEGIQNWVNDNVPELAESEDERIRKTLIELVRCNERSGYFSFNNIETSSIIAWLEKQKQIDEEEFKQGALKYVALQFMNWLDKEIPEDEMCLSNAECKVIEDAFLREDWTSISHYMQEKLEKQGGQKPADKVEPKFKVGDWIVKKNIVYHIDSISGVYLTLSTIDGTALVYHKSVLNNDKIHLWSIADAKDGDVLYSIGFHGKCIFIFNGLDKWRFDEPNGDRAVATGYCCLTVSANNMEFGIQGPDCIEVDTVKPATQEQRDLLFRKMGEAGYKWDSEKKEPKKIVSKTLDTNQIKKQDEQKFTDVEQKFHKGDYEDGIYLCYEDGYKKPFPTPYPLAVETTPHGLVTHIGIKVGEHKVGLKLNSLGEHELPYDRSLGSDDFGYKKQEIYALYDYDGEANTDHLEQHGEFEFDLDDDEWIPALGELAIIYKNRDKLNEALAFVGGDELVEDWHWSSTEYSAISAWFVNFCNGSVGNAHKSDGPVIRPVCAF